MADLIRIEDRLARASPRPSMTRSSLSSASLTGSPAGRVEVSGAVILMFTGIRYERLDGHPGKTHDTLQKN